MQALWLKGVAKEEVAKGAAAETRAANLAKGIPASRLGPVVNRRFTLLSIQRARRQGKRQRKKRIKPEGR